MKKSTDKPVEAASRLIRKANELVEARYRYGIWEMRVFAKLLSLIKPSDTDFCEYKIHISDFIKEFGLKKGGNIYQFIKEGAEGLLHKKVVVDEMMDGRLSELQTWMLSSVQTFKDEGEANYVLVTIHPKLKPYLLELRQKYLVYDIRNVLKLTSVYSIRIYELLKQYEKIGKRTFDVENLKLILGIMPQEYKLYGHFKDKVILKAAKDLATETDISFTFEENKEGKRVTSITFFIHPNPNGGSEEEPPQLSAGTVETKRKKNGFDSPFFKETFEKVKGWGVTEAKLRDLITTYGDERVREGLQCTIDNMDQGKVPDNPGGFFVRAVGEGWKSTKQVKIEMAMERKHNSKQKEAEAVAEITKWEISLENLVQARIVAAKDIVRDLTAVEPNLGELAVQGILSDGLTKGLLQNITGLQLVHLEMDDWRQHPSLRDAVIRQIERMRNDAFKEVQQAYDEPIKNARRVIVELTKNLKTTV